MNKFLSILLALAAALPLAAAAQVKLGNEVLVSTGFKALKGKRVGLLTNPSGVNRNLDTTIEVLRAAPGLHLAALFGPEHGVYGDVPAGDKVPNRTDERTGLPVYSLYGKTYRPTPEMLQGLDALVYDLQDTG
ncbi:MAG TPA: exo-beta-N-acetylmuramidase NamZ domain-containing protein, partial [Candidatus Acidoferrum sp.]|nr:exo-beta-N-acetylmuramidase NamZ domain-containing protein [Candidatus Acidoferrum sp.]